MERDKRIQIYAAQRGVTADYMGRWGIEHKLTAGQQRRIRKARRRYLYGRRNPFIVPF